jgi:Cd2+/Zn2+-exporting ATPase
MRPRTDLLPSDHGVLSLPVRLSTALLAALALLLSLLLRQLRPGQPELAGLCAFAAWAVICVPVFTGAVRGLFHTAKTLNPYYLDQFVAIVLLACLAGGRYATGSIVAIILIFGQLLEERSVRGIREAIEGLGRLSRVSARRLHGLIEEPADADTLQPGDRLRVLPGELIPADGRVLSGHSAVNQSAITGEALPADVAPGSTVFAGTLNLSGVIELETTRASSDTVIGKVRAILEAASTDRPLIARRLDTYLRYYTPAVLMLTAMVWILTRDLDRAVSVLVVCLPCAFVLAGPAVMVAALAVCARLGILVKTPRHFETASTLDTVVFDKTGTLTHGCLIVAETTACDPARSVSDFLPLARQLAAASQHPVARAIASVSSANESTPQPTATDVQETPGRGLLGRIEKHTVLLGSAAWLRENKIEPPPEPPESAGQRTVYATIDGRPALRFLLSDSLRSEARDVVETLGSLGLTRAVLLTGDHAHSAEAIATATGIPRFVANCLPEEKSREVHDLRASGRRVLVVGDGVNDAPALAAGDLGIALNNSGSHIAVQTADVAILQPDLRRLVHFIQISRRSLRLINQNLAVSTAIILVALLVSSLGLVGPLTAALLHETSAFFVLINSSRLLRFDA